MELKGNFSEDIRGTTVVFRNQPSPTARPTVLQSLPDRFTGTVEDMTAGLRNPVNRKYACADHDPVDHKLTPVRHGHFAWSVRGQRYVLDLEKKRVRVRGKRWAMMTGDIALDRHIADIATAVGFAFTTLGGRPALQLSLQNGVRELRPITAEQQARIEEVVADFAL